MLWRLTGEREVGETRSSNTARLRRRYGGSHYGVEPGLVLSDFLLQLGHLGHRQFMVAMQGPQFSFLAGNFPEKKFIAVLQSLHFFILRRDFPQQVIIVGR